MSSPFERRSRVPSKARSTGGAERQGAKSRASSKLRHVGHNVSRQEMAVSKVQITAHVQGLTHLLPQVAKLICTVYAKYIQCSREAPVRLRLNEQRESAAHLLPVDQRVGKPMVAEIAGAVEATAEE